MLHGDTVVDPCHSPVGYLGLTISYDIRFPEIYRKLTLLGSQALLIPSAFTAKTGASHWETLLRTRAIKNQCYVIAPAQSGKSKEGVLNYGHSMVVDPWGDIIAQASDSVSYFLCEMDLEYLDEVRSNMNCLTHIRLPNIKL